MDREDFMMNQQVKTLIIIKLNFFVIVGANNFE